MNQNSSSIAGFFFALAAFTIWGLLPLFWRLLEFAEPLEVLAHRALWSLPVAIIAVLFVGRFQQIAPTFKNPKSLAVLCLCALLISYNWGVFIWAIANNRVLESAMAYYINPLMSVALGVFFLQDKLTPLQKTAVGFAAAAVLVLTLASGSFPWIAITLAFTFAVYGYLRKTVDVGANQGFLIESIIIMAPAFVYLIWIANKGQIQFGASLESSLLLLLAGPATAIPLILFANGAKRLRLSTIGLMQYIAPTLMFTIATLVYGEPLSMVKLFAFILIWIALAIYSFSMIKAQKNHP